MYDTVLLSLFEVNGIIDFGPQQIISAHKTKTDAKLQQLVSITRPFIISCVRLRSVKAQSTRDELQCFSLLHISWSIWPSEP